MSYLDKANKAFLKKRYRESIELYEDAKEKLPLLKDLIQFNIELAQNRLGEYGELPVLKPIQKLPVTALVITWDVGHNPLGRSYMLAEALEKSVRNVVLCGFQFEKYGNDIWEPVRRGRLPVISLPGGNFSDWLETCEKAVKKFRPDVVIACKPRLPSVELGVLFKEKYGIPLIVDVDDHELSFFNGAQPIDLVDIEEMSEDVLVQESEPFGKIWTQLTDTLTKRYADGIITSNVTLEDDFGGTIVPHVRDENTFDPYLYDKLAQRRKYNLPESSKILMFFGTPRAHKGVGEIAEAVGKIGDLETILVVVGEATDKSVVNKLDELARGKVMFLPNQPFSAIPEIIVMADLIVLPQDVNHPISKYQLPAKAIDAIGMNIPLLVSGTKPLLQLVLDGVASLISNNSLEEVIAESLNKPEQKFELLERRRKFLLNYSYHSAALKLKSLISQVLMMPRKPLLGFSELKALQRKVFPPRVVNQNPSSTVDVVLFWKQNDTGLYGRRSDMVIKYLANRGDVRKVIVFDAPISQYDVEMLKGCDVLAQGRSIYIKIYEKLLGKIDSDKVSYNVFDHPPGIYTMNKSERGKKPLFDEYSKYIESVLSVEKVDVKNSVFWFYPKNFLATEIIDWFEPKRVVVDIVDDHRAWPNVSETEKRRLTQHYNEILDKADFVLANCQPVVDSMKDFRADIKLVPNGCESNPSIVEPKNHVMYEELKAFEGKVIGYVGNLEAKIDIELIEKISNSFRDALIVLVGSTHANSFVKELKRRRNIRMFGVLPYENVSSVVQRFDVGIVPHKKMNLTDIMNPLKVFVYLANRVPVVSTNVKNLPEFNGVMVADDHDQFIGLLHAYFASDKEKYSSSIDLFVNNNSWEARFDNVIGDILS